jgi:hypothetical protein
MKIFKLDLHDLQVFMTFMLVYAFVTASVVVMRDVPLGVQGRHAA